eukprot:TRINITY_DN1962_c0_g1_i6.p1 TRINITY_DN1962_c0_g1~~TRINITY_DN1962_c0_g1_i6.p1  ORF type:complete len:261 (+),score=70.00 TRINITY_DN1962_c0_g1_i6:219-1001(+)
MGVEEWSTDSIKMASGLGGSILSNALGIPFDRFRVVVAQDVASAHGLNKHLLATFQSPGAAFTGGFARISMKQIAASLNLYVPQEIRQEYPFASAFGVGVCFSPILNVPRMMQLGRISGNSYPETFRNTFMSGSGLKAYAQNTAMFAPGEGLRMMMCFGMKDWIMPRIGGKADAHEVQATTGVALYTAKMACIAGPAVAAVETTFALTTETISTIHANMHAKGGAGQQSFAEVVKKTITPAYTARCWTCLLYTSPSPRDS